jgi:hypothetical protein
MVQRVLGCGLVVLGLLVASTATAVAAWAPGSTFDVRINGVGSKPGQDYDQVVTDQPIDLDGVTLLVDLDGAAFCTAVPALENGTTYTLLSTTGGLSGRFIRFAQTLEEGDVYAPLLPFGRGCSPSAGGLELHYHESGPVQTVTATVVDGSPIPVTRTRLAADPGRIEPNQLTTIAATVSVSSSTAEGTVRFDDGFADNDSIACPDQHVTATADAPAVATCQMTQSVADDVSRAGWGASMNATFTPDDPALVRASNGFVWMTVRSGSTATQLTPAAETVTAGTPLDLLATVTPAFQGLFAPSGTVVFRDGGAVLPGCASLPLAGDGTVHCRAVFDAPGEHTLSAEYVAAGPLEPGTKAEFLGSTSPSATVAVSPAPPAPQPPIGGPEPPTGEPVPPQSSGGRGTTPVPRRAVARYLRHLRHARRVRHARRSSCRHRRAPRRAHKALAQRCSTTRHKHTRRLAG